MRKIILLTSSVALFSFIACGSSNDNPNPNTNILYSPNEIAAAHEETKQMIQVTCDSEWMIYSDDTWIDCTKNTTETATATIAANTLYSEREGNIVIKSGSTREYIPVKQDAKPDIPVDPSITVPEGYRLVWQDEFDDHTLSMPDENEWWYEVWEPGRVNNELQRYVKGKQGNEVTAEVSNGTLKIHAKKVDNEVISARVNTSESWKYGYFEARMKLPVGKGTWPAFWMMPKDYTSWPLDGEIDIMEHVGYRPNYVSSSIHCMAYYHSIKTEKTGEQYLATSQTEFNVYALEWTEDYIEGFVNGKSHFRFDNDKQGNKNTWPFNAPFYLKLNLAWGGDWGGAEGVDESVLPATFEIDYVRVFQKK